MPDINRNKLNHERLSGLVALVTGAAGGIGLAVCRRLAAEGARILMTDLDGTRLAAAADVLRANGAEVDTVVADLAKKGERDRLVPAAVERWGRFDILVNNAAFHGERRTFLDASEEEFEQIFAVNVMATAALCRAAARAMQAQGAAGAIVNIGSIQAGLPVPTYAAYVASKGAVAALTRALAVELAPAGIRVNAVLPGVIATEAFKQALADGADAKRQMPMTAALLERQGEAAEVAAAVTFLASSDASFITGAALPVDGGRSISRKADPFEQSFGDRTESGIPE
ncbi:MULTISPECIES: glucose 1-dehydrogenase [unclassified Sinorhizobium]|uniref:SDR family NAD(P)-dependent oxidoreductase n=1 Tax=unclassified Sinorhizobium TaxID=2613772 RepID=UPI0024C3EAFA|nr:MULTISPECIES: glucose 1-dehydrogenase [unclassified Sinorhizobium]MDK1377298.1 glucose 1-dehydrogenase [Sinorhizobium sp. 6-70]MDK1481573.1 glucose 1-dehydrogenase [Sinorhizobium sp. 6-117]